jgi:PleD family two-component response regulator
VEKLQVLIVDDDKDIAGFFSTVLSLVGLECEVVLTAREAFARMAGSVPDLILLDMRLGPEIGGEDILYQIRSNPRFDNTRVVVVTAYPSIASMVTNLADLVLIKPVEIEQLKTLVTRIGSLEINPRRSPFRDPVTQLFNKDFFITRLELAFERARRRPDFMFAAIVMELKLQGTAEEKMNPDTWIAILRGVADRLRRRLRPMDAISIFSNQKFASLHEELKNADDLNIILGRLRETLSESFSFEGKLYVLHPYFGHAIYDKQFKGPLDFLNAAETALMKALEK